MNEKCKLLKQREEKEVCWGWGTLGKTPWCEANSPLSLWCGRKGEPETSSSPVHLRLMLWIEGMNPTCTEDPLVMEQPHVQSSFPGCTEQDSKYHIAHGTPGWCWYWWWGKTRVHLFSPLSGLVGRISPPFLVWGCRRGTAATKVFTRAMTRQQ